MIKVFWVLIFIVSFIDAKRLALVIGNSNYSIGRLSNPVRDANLIAQKLREVGFTVTVKTNLKSLYDMKEAVNNFVKKLSKDDIAVVYYSGHGVQFEGKNYLLPTEANIAKAKQLPSEALNLDFLIGGVSDTKLSILFLDACRDNPFPAFNRGVTKGLAIPTTNSDGGMIISFATQANQTASDGDENQSPYALAISKYITQPQPIEQFLKSVGRYVAKATNYRQKPMFKVSFYDDFYFVSKYSSRVQEKNRFKGFEKTFGGKDWDKASAITQTKDGGFIVAGKTESFRNENKDIYLIKIDKSGNKIWQKTFGGGSDDWANAIIQTKDGGVIVAGGTYSFGNGRSDAYLIKIDKNGNKVWQKTFGGGSDDWANAITQTKGGGFIVAGETKSFGNSEKDVYLIKIDENGNEVWQKTFGGKDWDTANAITQTKDGGFIVAGETKSFGNRKADIYLIKIDENGNKVWQKTFGGNKNDRAYAITQTKDGGFIVAGETWSFGNGKGDVYIIKIDEDSNEVWQKTFGRKDLDEAYAITQTKDGGFIVAGTTKSFGNKKRDVYLIKIDTNGNKIWQKTFGRRYDDWAKAITQTDNDGFIVAGYTYSFRNGKENIYLIKIDKDGNIK